VGRHQVNLFFLEATKEVFNVSRPTLFRWQKNLSKGLGKLESLNNKSTTPKRKRKRLIPEAVKAFILQERQYDSRLSKDKLSAMMKTDGVANLSASTVGRMLNDLKKQGVLPDPIKYSFYGKTGRLIERKIRKPRVKLRSKGHTGHLV
jgi:hypothetical protein